MRNADDPQLFFLPGLGRKDCIVRRVQVAGEPLEQAGFERTHVAQARIPGYPQLEAHVRFVTRRGKRVAYQITVVCPDPDRLPKEGITVAVLRAVRLGKVQAEVSEILAREEGLGRLPARHLDGFRVNPRPGRGGRDLYDYAVWAQRYVEKLGSRHPIKELIRDWPGYSEHAIRARLNRARASDLLTDSPKGKAGGALTPKARDLLASRETDNGTR